MSDFHTILLVPGLDSILSNTHCVWIYEQLWMPDSMAFVGFPNVKFCTHFHEFPWISHTTMMLARIKWFMAGEERTTDVEQVVILSYLSYLSVMQNISYSFGLKQPKSAHTNTPTHTYGKKSQTEYLHLFKHKTFSNAKRIWLSPKKHTHTHI